MKIRINSKEFPSHIEVSNYDDIRDQIKTGDILLCSGRGIVSRIIQLLTRSKWSHVGFICVSEFIGRKEVNVFESVEGIGKSGGVRSFPLSSYLNGLKGGYDGEGNPYNGAVCVARHCEMEKITDFSPIFEDRHMSWAYGWKEFLGIFLRLIFKSLLRNVKLTNRKGYICSELVDQLYSKLGITLYRKNTNFIVPSDIASDKNVYLKWVLKK